AGRGIELVLEHHGRTLARTVAVDEQVVRREQMDAVLVDPARAGEVAGVAVQDPNELAAAGDLDEAVVRPIREDEAVVAGVIGEVVDVAIARAVRLTGVEEA